MDGNIDPHSPPKKTSMRALIAVLLVMLVCGSVKAAPTPIPEFTPNVVDSAGVLDAAADERVNAEILRLRESSRIMAGVYIVPSLGEESIEELAVRAFEKWKLGQAGVDNGLLLVLAMQDRESRFEVGYGLEGSITDVAALHALDHYLAPRMREGDVAGAIVDALGYLSRVVEQDPVALQELAAVEEQAEDWGRGLRAWGLFLIPVWTAVPLFKGWIAWRRRRLFAGHPELALKAGDETVVNADAAAAKKKSGIRWGTIGLCLFLSVNPGVFILIFWAVENIPAYLPIAIPGVLVLLVVWLKGRKYGSSDRYQAHLRKVEQERTALINQGYLARNSAGSYSYTPAYHASRRSSSSSSGSSSRSSSSGGGRSGGGGASSRW